MKSTLLGHQGRCFDVRFSSDGSKLVSASEDGTAIVWNPKLHKPESIIKHNKDTEVLRTCFLSNQCICTSGADGQAYVWLKSNDDKPKYSKSVVLSHGDTQIYSCEAISERAIITAAENCLYLWDVAACSSSRINSDVPSLEPVSCWSFDTAVSADNNSSSNFGGPRNPDNTCYIFDAKVSPTCSNLIALAMSDGTVRRVDGRDPRAVSVSAMPLAMAYVSPNSHATDSAQLRPSHITSVSWSEDANYWVASTGAGDAAVIDLRRNAVRAILRGHSSSCFGAAFVPSAFSSSSPPSSSSSPMNTTDAGTTGSGESGDDDRNSEGVAADSIWRTETTATAIVAATETDSSSAVKIGARGTSSSTARPRNSPSTSSSSSSSSSSSDRCFTWSSDCTLKLWDISTNGVFTDPLETFSFPQYPVYCCSSVIIEDTGSGSDSCSGSHLKVAVGGGSGAASFVGNPLHVLSLPITSSSSSSSSSR